VAPGEDPHTPICATRASALALIQTRTVLKSLAERGIRASELHITTRGDMVQDRSLAALGTDSIFVKELELALRERRADFAVHSCKDLPSALPSDMHLAAITTRADPRDAFCSERFGSLDALPDGAVVGTSSPRRAAQLQALRDDLQVKSIRGNLETRLQKLRDGDFDAIVLATAGMDRLGIHATHVEPLDARLFVPAVGQGALGIETRAGDEAFAALLASALADVPSTLAVSAERAFLRGMRGGCQAPIGAHAAFDGAGLTLIAAVAVARTQGGPSIERAERRAEVTDVAAAERLGRELAEEMAELPLAHAFAG